MAKNPIPTEAKPQPATSSYLKAPKAIKATPTKIMMKVAQASTVFLFIPICLSIWFVVTSNIGNFKNFDLNFMRFYDSKGKLIPAFFLTRSKSLQRSIVFW